MAPWPISRAAAGPVWKFYLSVVLHGRTHGPYLELPLALYGNTASQLLCTAGPVWKYFLSVVLHRRTQGPYLELLLALFQNTASQLPCIVALYTVHYTGPMAHIYRAAADPLYGNTASQLPRIVGPMAHI